MNGKITENKKKKIKEIIQKNKPIVFLVGIMLIGVVGGTLAYYYTRNTLENDFRVADYNVTLEETFPINEWDEDNELEKEVRIVNKGEASVLLRISYNEIWYKGEEILNNLSNGVEIVTKNWNEEFRKDFEYHEGWYYYKKELARGESVTILNSITKTIDVYNEEEINYELDFNYEVVQADNKASERVWGYGTKIENGEVKWQWES